MIFLGEFFIFILITC